MEDKKTQILEAAKGLFNRLGYAKTSVDDIAGSLGMKKSSLYYYFKNKEDVFMCSFKIDWERNFKNFEQIADKEKKPADKIVSYTTQSLNYYKAVVIQHKIPMKVLIETRNLYRDFVNKINQGGVRFFEKCIQEGIDTGLFNECDIPKTASALALIKFSIQYDQFTALMHAYPKEEDLERIKEDILFVLKLMLKGLSK